MLRPGAPCFSCGQPPMAMAAPYVMPYVIQAPKSSGIAVLLSFLVLGGGYLYLNKIGVGIALIAWDVFLFLVFLIPFIGWVLGFFLWLVSFVVVACLVVSEANSQNRALYGHGGVR